MTSSKTNAMRKWLLTGLLILVTIGVFSAGYYWRKKWQKDHIYVRLVPIHTDLGWGYDIWTDTTRFMHQDIIPAIPGQHGFRTKEDALAVGQLVYNRLMAGKMPMVTPEEIKKMGLMPDSTKGSGKSPGSKPDSLTK